jgi:PTH1 family peptidyl-tRNA hydrolase
VYLFVGLGNIGKEYENTRHNFGFMCIEGIIEKYKIENHQTKFNSDVFFGEIGGNKVIIAKPRTYMNRSGVAVSQIKSFYKIFLENIFIFHDDLDLEFCRVKYKIGGGAAGHNGIKNIDEMIGKNYNRIRLGIGRPLDNSSVVDFVLQKFSENEVKMTKSINEKIGNNVAELFKENKNYFLNAIAT